ncbi:MAG: M48 family metalloprotease [Nitrospirae bacterium]|nr:M48 family metalloprotease [Nitrospirota bacterium]
MGRAPRCRPDRGREEKTKGNKGLIPILYLPNRYILLLVGAIALLFLTRCALPQLPEQKRSEPALPPLRLTEEVTRSKKLGREFLTEARKQFKFVKDPDVVDAVNRIGNSILLANGEEPQAYHFLVVKENIPNAFAVPGGYIFVFDGLLSRMNSVDELAGVLSHEIGHVKKDHFFKEDKKATFASLAGIVAALLTREPGAAVAGALSAESLGLSFSREHEREADSIGLRFLNQAGYNPEGLYHFFKTLQTYEKYNPSLVPAYFSTHPAVEEREVTMQMFIRSLPPPPGDAAPVSLDWERIRALVEIENDPNKPISDFLLDPFKKGVPEVKKHYLAGLFYQKNNQFHESIAELKQAVKMDPGSSLNHSSLASALFKGDRLDEAKKEAETSLLLDPGNGEGEMVLGFVWEGKGNPPASIEHFEKAKILRGKDPMIHFKLGSLYTASGDRKEASWNLARYYRLEIQPEKALNELEKARELFAGDRVYRSRVEEEILDILREGI